MASTHDSELRAHWTLDPELHFLNHGSFGATPRVVLEAQSELRAAMERTPVAFLAREIWERLDVARHAAATFLGAEPAGLVAVPNATTGVNTVLRSLRFEPGDEILVTDHGYNACTNAARFVAERAGAKVTAATIPFPCPSSDAARDAILDAVTPRTRLVLFDHVTSATGMILPARELVQALEARGVDSLIDGAHAPGMLPLELDALGAAYYTGNFHKWVCAPKGAAFLYVRADRREGLRPIVISHGANSPRRDKTRFEVEFEWVGTHDPTAFLCVPHSIDFLRSLLPGGFGALRARNRDLTLRAKELLCSALDAPPPCPDDMLGSLVSVRMPDATDGVSGPQDAFRVDPQQLVLYDEHRVEVPIMGFPAAPQRIVRVSCQAYNSADDLDALVSALDKVLA